ncbi:MAG: YCF48-related protein [Acidiferrobacterales bacterium]|nr:YCF48-related protein [Acidiferrobacterales bacterium]
MLIGLCLIVFEHADAEVAASHPARLSAQSLLLDVTFTGKRVIAVGQRGHILVSDDLGLSWTQVQSPVNVLLSAVKMLDEDTGFAVGHDAVILRTKDAGNSWQLMHYAPHEERPLLDVWFTDSMQGFAIGSFGFFLSTEDGGESWQPKTISEDDYHLNAVAADINPILYIGAEAGVAYRSDDAGKNFSEVDSPYSGSWFGVLAIPPDTVYLCGLRGGLYRSDDGGQSWRQINTGTTATLTGIARFTNGGVVVTGLDGTLLISFDGGQTFTLRQFPDRLGISAAEVLPDNKLVLVGMFGVRYLESSEWMTEPLQIQN